MYIPGPLIIYEKSILNCNFMQSY